MTRRIELVRHSSGKVIVLFVRWSDDQRVVEDHLPWDDLTCMEQLRAWLNEWTLDGTIPGSQASKNQWR